MCLCANSCGHDTDSTLSYTCASDSTEETFSIQSFRYVGGSDGDSVYFHCDLKVCLSNTLNSASDCPSVCPPENRRKRRAFDEIVDESYLYHVTVGPFIFEDGKKDIKEQENKKDEVNKEGT